MITIELLDKVFQYDSSEQGAENIIKSIAGTVSDNDMIIDSMDIDGSIIYSEYDEYIRKNTGNIEYIRVNLITKDELITNILQTTYSYIQGAMPELQHIIDSFYTGEKSAAIIDELSGLAEGITWMYSVGREIIAMDGDNSCLKAMLSRGYDKDIQRLEEAFNELKNAIMNMDYILIADILNYEIADIFSIMKAAMEDIMTDGETSSRSKGN